MLKSYSQMQKLEEGKGKVEAIQSEQIQMKQRKGKEKAETQMKQLEEKRVEAIQ